MPTSHSHTEILQRMLTLHMRQCLHSEDPFVNPYRYNGDLPRKQSMEGPKSRWIVGLRDRWRGTVMRRRSKLRRLMTMEAVKCVTLDNTESHRRSLRLLMATYPFRLLLQQDRQRMSHAKTLLELLHMIEESWQKMCFSARLFYLKCRLRSLRPTPQRTTTIGSIEALLRLIEKCVDHDINPDLEAMKSDVDWFLERMEQFLHGKPNPLTPEQEKQIYSIIANCNCLMWHRIVSTSHAITHPVEEDKWDDTAALARTTAHFLRVVEHRLPSILNDMVQRLRLEYPTEFSALEAIYTNVWSNADTIVHIISLGEAQKEWNIPRGTLLKHWDIIGRYRPVLKWDMVRNVLLLYACRWLISSCATVDHTLIDSRIEIEFLWLHSLFCTHDVGQWRRCIDERLSSKPYIHNTFISSALFQELVAVKRMEVHIASAIDSRIIRLLGSSRIFGDRTMSTSARSVLKIVDNIHGMFSSAHDNMPSVFRSQWSSFTFSRFRFSVCSS